MDCVLDIMYASSSRNAPICGTLTLWNPEWQYKCIAIPARIVVLTSYSSSVELSQTCHYDRTRRYDAWARRSRHIEHNVKAGAYCKESWMDSTQVEYSVRRSMYNGSVPVWQLSRVLLTCAVGRNMLENGSCIGTFGFFFETFSFFFFFFEFCIWNGCWTVFTSLLGPQRAVPSCQRFVFHILMLANQLGRRNIMHSHDSHIVHCIVASIRVNRLSCNNAC